MQYLYITLDLLPSLNDLSRGIVQQSSADVRRLSEFEHQNSLYCFILFFGPPEPPGWKVFKMILYKT